MRSAGKRAPTLEDVARVAGVSHQTVSRVINGYEFIRPATADRVLAAIEQLGYRRNTVARSLVTARTDTIGVVVTDLVHFGPASALGGVERAARERGYGVSFVSIGGSDAAAMSQALERLAAQAVDGVIVVAPENEAVRAARLSFGGLPIVSMSASAVHDELGVEVDTEAGARLATGYLIGLGHRHILHLAGPAGYFVTEARTRGWRSALAEHGLVAVEPIAASGWRQADGYEVGRRIAARLDATAVFVANDELAQGALLAFHEAGIRVPEDLSVVGYDDGPAAAYCIPPLTTVRQDFADLGKRAIGTLLAQLDGESAVPSGSPTQELVVRGSSAPPRED